MSLSVCLYVCLAPLYLFIYLYLSVVSAFVCVLPVRLLYILPDRKVPISKFHHSKDIIIIPEIEIRTNLPQSCKLSVVQPTTKTNCNRMNNNVLLPVGLNTTRCLKRNASRRAVLYKTNDSYHVSPRVGDNFT